MRLSLLVKKLQLMKNKYILSSELKKYCKMLDLDYYVAIRYLISQNYLVTLMKGIFYIKSIEEKKLDKTEITYFDAIIKLMEIKKVNWYFGLESAIKLNNLTHEYFTVETILTDKIFRPTPIKILGVYTKFFKIKKKLFSLGIIEREYRFSDLEKTLLDIIYLSRYNSISEISIKNRIAPYLKYMNKKKVLEYEKYYPKTMRGLLLND